jgi:uncharacterized protein (DUF1501 family)
MQHMGLDRRRFLSLVTAGLLAPNLLADSASAAVRLQSALPDGASGQPLLVLVQLSGGNDGLNTLVPLESDEYRRLRPKLALPTGELLRLDADFGLHPALVKIHALCQAGRAAWVPGVGYPGSNLSHFKSMEIWHAADEKGRLAGPGWVTRLVSALYGDQAQPTRLVHVGRQLPYALYSARHPAIAFPTPEFYRRAGEAPPEPTAMEPRPTTSSNLDFLRDVLRDANASSLEVQRAAARYRPRVDYPNDEFARALSVAAALIDARLGAEVISVELGGFDTHNNQLTRHQQQMEQLDGALGAFLADLDGHPAAANLLVCCFSEFGRRAAENGSGGTDHGTAGPVLLAGPSVRPGIHGRYPALDQLDERGNLGFTTDFRRLYATFGADPRAVVGEGFAPLDCLQG